MAIGRERRNRLAKVVEALINGQLEKRRRGKVQRESHQVKSIVEEQSQAGAGDLKRRRQRSATNPGTRQSLIKLGGAVEEDGGWWWWNGARRGGRCTSELS